MIFSVFFYNPMVQAKGSLSSKSFKGDQEKEKIKIRKVIKNFIEYILKMDYAMIQKITTGREREIYKKYKKMSSLERNMIGKTSKSYFSGIKKYSCYFIYVDLKLKKSIAKCSFEFKTNSISSSFDSRKVRKIYYYLAKQKDRWKIAYSKLKNEFILLKKNR